ncbi:MAG: CBS domain-containing protein [Gemmatimonadota bacterium]
MKIHEVLDRKGRNVVTVAPEATVAFAVRLLVHHGIGSVVVTRGERILGILTERDVLRLADRDPTVLALLPVSEVMTAELVVGAPDDDLSYVMEVMTNRRVRHLPVVDEGVLQGLISIGDVVNALRRTAEHENHFLRDYVQGVVR